MFEPSTDEMKGDKRKLHKKEFNNLYPSQDIIRIKSRRMKWSMHVARVGGIRNALKIEWRT
jgi:hypothetical protein